MTKFEQKNIGLMMTSFRQQFPIQKPNEKEELSWGVLSLKEGKDFCSLGLLVFVFCLCVFVLVLVFLSVFAGAVKWGIRRVRIWALWCLSPPWGTPSWDAGCAGAFFNSLHLLIFFNLFLYNHLFYAVCREEREGEEQVTALWEVQNPRHLFIQERGHSLIWVEISKLKV